LELKEKKMTSVADAGDFAVEGAVSDDGASDGDEAMHDGTGPTSAAAAASSDDPPALHTIVSGDDEDAPPRETISSTRATIQVSNKAENKHATRPILRDANDDSSSNSSSSAVAHLLNDVASALHDATSIDARSSNANTSSSLQTAYQSIRHASMQAILSSLVVYALTAVGISLNTRGLDEKVIAIIVGASQFMTALMVFIVSAKVPQWIGVYHQGAIRLVKCSSNYSQQFERIDITDQDNLNKLRFNVRLGVWFHFSKFYIVLMPFYCGVQRATIPVSILLGAIFGFILMWAVFVVHEKYIHHRNIVSITTILLLSIISALTFTRGMAWIQVVWKLNILRSEDTLMVISFFGWLLICVMVHLLFLWHTLRTEEAMSTALNTIEEEEDIRDDIGGNNDVALGEDTGHLSTDRDTSKRGRKPIRRSSNSFGSYSSFVFDPRTHFKDGKCQFSDHPEVEKDFTNDSTDIMGLPLAIDCAVGNGEQTDFYIETPVGISENGNGVTEFGNEIVNDAYPNNNTIVPDTSDPIQTNIETTDTNARCQRPACCSVFVCYSPEYQQSSLLWKVIVWLKIIIMIFAYFLCLYFVAVCIGATYQISTTRAGLPAVHEALYNHMDEGPVCAFDNRGPDSNITTFEDKEAAHEAGFLIVHCGACGACSSWENLVVEWTTRNNMAALANECAQEALFGGGDDALTECLMHPSIGFGYECAVCWMEDILCTKDHCAFIFLQSQMINNVGNFAVGPNEITSASCEEAHCEVGQFVPCSGATRRRMNIVSSISRPGDQQCGIVDVESWQDLFFGSGVA